MSGKMSRKISVLFLITLSSVCANIDDKKVMTRFAIDATRADGIGPSPSTVAAFLCMEKDELFFFMKHASLNQILFTVKNPLAGFDDEIFSRDFNPHRNYYFLDVNCPGAVDILRKANLTGMITGPTKWLLFQDLRPEKSVQILNTIRETHLYDLFGNLSVYPDSDVVIGQRVDSDLVRLISIYKPSPVRVLVVENRGYWEDGKGISSISTEVSSIRRKDLRRTPLKSSLVMTNPNTINHLTDFHDRYIDSITEANYPWVLYLVEMMNATDWGYRDSNGTWSGMIGGLIREEIDLGGTARFLTSERIDLTSLLHIVYNRHYFAVR